MIYVEVRIVRKFPQSASGFDDGLQPSLSHCLNERSRNVPKHQVCHQNNHFSEFIRTSLTQSETWRCIQRIQKRPRPADEISAWLSRGKMVTANRSTGRLRADLLRSSVRLSRRNRGIRAHWSITTRIRQHSSLGYRPLAPKPSCCSRAAMRPSMHAT